jgi:hypothetical protein
MRNLFAKESVRNHHIAADDLVDGCSPILEVNSKGASFFGFQVRLRGDNRAKRVRYKTKPLAKDFLERTLIKPV